MQASRAAAAPRLQAAPGGSHELQVGGSEQGAGGVAGGGAGGRGGRRRRRTRGVDAVEGRYGDEGGGGDEHCASIQWTTGTQLRAGVVVCIDAGVVAPAAGWRERAG